MRTVLLLTLLLAGQPFAVASDLSSEFRAASNAVMRNSNSDAEQHLRKVIDEAGADRTSQLLRRQALLVRATLRLRTDRPAEARDDYLLVLKQSPNDPKAYSGLEMALRRLGDVAAADEAAKHGKNVHQEALDYFDECFLEALENDRPWTAKFWLWLGWLSRSPSGLKMLLLWCGVWFLNLWAGWRQKRDGGGTVARWVWVTAIYAVLELAPFVVWWFMYDFIEPPEEPGTRLRVGKILCVLGAVNALVLLGNLRFAFRFGTRNFVLPLVQDEDLLRRVARIAVVFRLPVPRVRELQGFGGKGDTLAFVGGLVAPSVLVKSGIRNRLTIEEQESILAHELAHIANKSLWYDLTLPSLILASAAVVGIWLPGLVTFAWAFLLWIGLSHLGSRWFEYDCDRRAARMCGFRVGASSLTKIHAASELRQQGWLSRLIFATATHPSLSQRIAALRRIAPADDMPEPVNDVSSEDSVRRISRIAVGIWMGSLVGGLWLSTVKPDWKFGIAGALCLLALTPRLLIVAANRRQRVRDARLQGKSRWLAVGFWASVAISVASYWFTWNWLHSEIGSSEPMGQENMHLHLWLIVLPLIGLAVALCLLFAYFYLFRRDAASDSQQEKIAAALQRLDIQEALSLAEATSPRKLAKSPELRVQLVMLRHSAGQQAAALRDAETLVAEQPNYPMGLMELIGLYFNVGRFQDAMPHLQRLLELVPNEPVAHLYHAAALRQVGQMDLAEAAARRATELDPDLGNATAILAVLAAQRGEFSEADKLIQQAMRQLPAEPGILLNRAEIALLRAERNLEGSVDGIQTLLDEALTAIKRNPFALFQWHVKQLSERLRVIASTSVATWTEDQAGFGAS